MVQRILLAALLVLSATACVTPPEEGEKEAKKEPDAKYCDTDADDRLGTEVCRQY
ncbi:hypothetical protein [Parvularcula marina]|uniref:hypothetical protein n=1 Tax=Parvularcula marina TaxID=2292771 RepID=UPI001314172F|nr:hypothetical protein [Parvularcula marina]